jgi:hypothetical protein
MRFPRTSALLVALLFLSVQCVTAQDSTRTHYANVFAELGGHGGIYSFNYENRVNKLHAFRLNWTAGLSVLPVAGRAVVDFPLGINAVFGKTKHKLEAGTSQVLILDLGGGKGGTIRGNIRIGYRYEKPGSRSYWLFSYSPFYSYIHNFQYDNWFGAAWGFYLKK